MTKAVLFPISFILLLTASIACAQTSSYDTNAINEAVMRQADVIVLRQKLTAASAAVQQKDFVAAAKLYEDAYDLVQRIGGQISIPQETQDTISGLVATHMELAREAQREGDLHQADVQVTRVLTVEPQNPEAIAFKKQNDQMIAQMRGTRPDLQTQEEAPAIQARKTDAATLARDGQMLYEMGKLEEAGAKLEQALQLDPDNRGAYYYMNLVKEARYAREDRHKNVDNSDRIMQVERAWEQPISLATNICNPYFMTNVIYTGAGRQTIYAKLNKIMMGPVNYQSLPLSEVIRSLREESQIRDPDKVGINFNFNPTIENIPSTADLTGAGGAGARGGAATTINPATGLPEEQPAATQPADATQINVNLTLSNVSMADLLNAICMFSDHPIKYSVEDYGIIFSQKGPDSPQYEFRTFKVDPNTFYSGLQNVNSFLFGSVNLTSGGSGGSGGGGGGGGGQGTVSGAVVPVVDVSPGASSARATSGGAGGGGGGAGGAGGGGGGGAGGAVLENGLSDLNSRVQDSGGGLLYVTTPNLTRDVSALAKEFFTALGLNLDPPKQVYFNDRLGVLFVYATPQDLDIMERAIQVLNEAPPMVHIKSRFIDVLQNDNTGLGFDWYLGQFNIGGSAVGQAGNAGSLTVPVSAANPEGTFPGNPTLGTTISSSVQSLTSGLNSGGAPGMPAIPALGTITGILTNPNFQVVLHALEQRSGTQVLEEPEVTTISGRQTQMRATIVQPIVTGYNFQSAPAAASTSGIP